MNDAGRSRSSTRSASIPSFARAPRSSTGTPAATKSSRPLAADSQPEQEPATGDVVERRGLLRDEARMPERKEHDAGSERDPARDGGERRERDAEVEDRVVEREVLAGPDRVVAELLGELARRPGTGPGRGARLGAGRFPGSRSSSARRHRQPGRLPGLLVVRHQERQVILHLRTCSVLVARVDRLDDPRVMRVDRAVEDAREAGPGEAVCRAENTGCAAIWSSRLSQHSMSVAWKSRLWTNSAWRSSAGRSGGIVSGAARRLPRGAGGRRAGGGTRAAHGPRSARRASGRGRRRAA